MARKTRRRAVGLWAYLVAGDLSSEDPDPVVELERPYPLYWVRDLIRLLAEVGSRQATEPYLEELELLGLATWHRGQGHRGNGQKDPGFVTFHNPDGPIPYLRPPCVLEGDESARFEVPTEAQPGTDPAFPTADA